MTGRPYNGFQRKLIIAFDVGTTFSGVSYAVLIPRELPLIHGVTKYVTALVAVELLMDQFSDSQVNTIAAAIARYQVSSVMMEAELSSPLVRKLTQM